MTKDKQTDEVSRKLNMIIKLLAYQLVAEKTVVHGAAILNRMGLTAPEIADIFGTTPSSVRGRLAEARKRRK